MHPSELPKATAAALAIASELDLTAEDAVVLNDSDQIAVRLLPCDVVAMVAPTTLWDAGAESGAAFTVELAQRLAETGSPVAALEPRVEPRAYMRDGFVATLWTYYENEPFPDPDEPATADDTAWTDYATALARLHAGMRRIDIRSPHCTDRIDGAQRLVDSRDLTPDLADADRQLLSNTVRDMRRSIIQRGAAEQLLHGEPHPGNVLRTKTGLVFIDLGTACRGPVEFDLAYVPEPVSDQYPNVDQDLLRACRVLMLAMVAAWRWNRDDHFPNRDHWRRILLTDLRAALRGDGPALLPHRLTLDAAGDSTPGAAAAVP